MTEDRKKIIQKAHKIKALADRGINGEMDTAKIMFTNYVEKHKITEDELKSFDSNATYDFSSLSDEEFINEIIREIIPIGFGVLFSRYGDSKAKDYSNAQAVNFLNKYLNAIFERVSKQTKK